MEGAVKVDLRGREGVPTTVTGIDLKAIVQQNGWYDFTLLWFSPPRNAAVCGGGYRLFSCWWPIHLLMRP